MSDHIQIHVALFGYSLTFGIGPDWRRINPATVMLFGFGMTPHIAEMLANYVELYMGWVSAPTTRVIDPWAVANSYRSLHDKPSTIDSADWTGRYRDDRVFGRLYPYRTVTVRWGHRLFHKVIEGEDRC